MSDGWRPTRILLVDDENSVMFALKLLLGALGFQVEGFTSPEEALSFAKGDSACELCICDLRMPGLSGLQVLEQIKSARPSLLFVLMSAHAGDEEVEKARALGADGFLSKPFSPDDLNLVIAELATRRIAKVVVPQAAASPKGEQSVEPTVAASTEEKLCNEALTCPASTGEEPTR